MKSPEQEKRLQTTLRLPKEIDTKVTSMAKKMGISKNAYILMIITKALEKNTA